jgi:hypothetical protein
MDLVFVIAFLGVIAAVVVGMVVTSSRQRRKRASLPARHVGEKQSQRGRVYKYGTNHSNTPDSW